MLEIIEKFNDLHDNYVVSSDKIYIIGAQDGTFHKLGYHVEGEMGGIISQPVKLVDSYVCSFTFMGDDYKLEKAEKFVFNNNRVEFHYVINDIKIIRTEICLDGRKAAYISYSSNVPLDSIRVSFNVSATGCWTAEDAGFGSDKIKVICECEDGCVIKNADYDWYVGVFSGKNCKVTYLDNCVTLQPRKKSNFYEFYVNSNNNYLNQLLTEKEFIKDNIAVLISKKDVEIEKYLSYSHIDTSDKEFNDVFNNLKLNYLMLLQSIDGVGSGYTAGYPDFPWFFGCDTFYSIPGIMAVGQHKHAVDTLRLIYRLSRNHNDDSGRIIHEISPFGKVYNYGNIQETVHFITSVWDVFLWTGNAYLLSEMYEFCKMGMNWVNSNCDDSSIFPIGYGITEIEGLNARMIDTAVMTYSAYKALWNMACILDNDDKDFYKEMHLKYRDAIREHFYIEDEHIFADVLCTHKEVLGCMDKIINSVKNTPSQTEAYKKYLENIASKEYNSKELIPLVLKNWVVILPLLEDILDETSAKRATEHFLKDTFFNAHGMKLSGMCDDANEYCSDLYATNVAMSLSTGCAAGVAAKHGFADKAYDIIKLLCKSSHTGMPGAISEILPNSGCFMQLWSGYAIHNVFMHSILGISVNAYAKEVTIKPVLPKALEYVSIKNIRVGSTSLDIDVRKDNLGNLDISYSCRDNEYKIITS